MFSQATIIGNIGADPEVRNTKTGKKVCSFSVASETGWGDNKETQWHKVITFDEKLIDNVIEKYATKGTKVFLQGELKYRNWEDKEGKKVYVTEIIMGFGSSFKLLGSKSESGEKPAFDKTPSNKDPFDLDDDMPNFN
jgi:single-strand DNA-binding protein